MYCILYIYIYIHIHVLCPSQDSSVWLGLTSREQLMSPECSKHQVLRFAYIYIYIYIYITFINFDFEMFAIFFSILRLNFQYFSFLALGFISNYYYFISNGLLNTYDI